MRMILFKASAIMVGCLLAATAQQASADSINFDLTVGNTGSGGISGYPSPFANVAVDLTAPTAATITFTAYTTGGYTYLLSSPGVNLNASSFTVTSGFTFTQTSGNKEDGFGKFNLVLDTGSGFPSGVSSLAFDVVDTSGTWSSASDVLTPNKDGSTAATHIYVLSSANATSALATGFAANGADVPDGGTTALLLGAAISALSVLRRKLA